MGTKTPTYALFHLTFFLEINYNKTIMFFYFFVDIKKEYKKPNKNNAKS